MDSKTAAFKKGMIILWSGAIADIPGGWQLCDGTNGSPNLKNNFVVGAGDSYVVDAVGGAINHIHTFTGDGHSHNIDGGTGLQAGTDFNNNTAINASEGETDAVNGLPPYRALAYIMKL